MARLPGFHGSMLWSEHRMVVLQKFIRIFTERPYIGLWRLRRLCSSTSWHLTTLLMMNVTGYYILRRQSHPDIQDRLPALGRVGDCRRDRCFDLAS